MSSKIINSNVVLFTFFKIRFQCLNIRQIKFITTRFQGAIYTNRESSLETKSKEKLFIVFFSSTVSYSSHTLPLLRPKENRTLLKDCYVETIRQVTRHDPPLSPSFTTFYSYSNNVTCSIGISMLINYFCPTRTNPSKFNLHLILHGHIQD